MCRLGGREPPIPLVPYSLHILKDLADRLRSDPGSTGRALCLSHPDVIATPEAVEAIFGLAGGSLSLRADSATSIAWHKAHSLTDRLVDTSALFEAIGLEMTAIDVFEGRGGEVPVDLSDPAEFPGADGGYDLVYDCITNQVFNVAQAMWTAARSCRVGGFVFHTIPVQMVNQGFWNVSPAAYYDFYRVNGFEIESSRYVVGVYEDRGEVLLDSRIRQRLVPDDTMNVIIARKVEARSGPVWPIMSKFVLHPGAVGKALQPIPADLDEGLDIGEDVPSGGPAVAISRQLQNP